MSTLALKDINAGEILLQELCNYFNKVMGNVIITDILNIHADDKQELLRFINKKTENKCNYQLRSLDRLIVKVKKKELMGKIPTSNPTLSTICYIVLKGNNPTLQFRHQTDKKGIVHGQSFYSVDFTKEFVEPLLATKSSIVPIPRDFVNACWYSYINVVDKKTLIRKTGRKILKFIKENDTTVKVEYYSNNPTNADWTGTAHYNSFKRRLYLRLKTSLNTLRNMSIDFHVSQISTPTIVKAYLSFTTMKEMDKEIQTKIFLVKAICSEDLSLAEFSTGEDPSIKEIEEKLKHVKAKTISINQTCNHCTGDI